VLGYTNQFLINDLSERWSFAPFYTAIYLVWDSDCVTGVRRTGSAVEWHQYSLAIQQDMEVLRTKDAEDDENEASRYWDGRSSEGADGYVSKLVGDATGADSVRIRADYDGVRALLAFWLARSEQGSSNEPSVDAALMLFEAIRHAQDGDNLYDFARRRELQGLRALDEARHGFELSLQRRREELAQAGYIPPREGVELASSAADFETLERSAIERAQQAAAEEQRQRSSRGGIATARHYGEVRERLIERFKATVAAHRSIAAAAAEPVNEFETPAGISLVPRSRADHGWQSSAC